MLSLPLDCLPSPFVSPCSGSLKHAAHKVDLSLSRIYNYLRDGSIGRIASLVAHVFHHQEICHVGRKRDKICYLSIQAVNLCTYRLHRVDWRRRSIDWRVRGWVDRISGTRPTALTLPTEKPSPGWRQASSTPSSWQLSHAVAPLHSAAITSSASNQQ